LLKHLLSTSTSQPLGTYYGALLGLTGVAGAEGVRVLMLPNLGVVDEVLRDALAESGGEMGDVRKREVEAVVDVIIGALGTLEAEQGGRGDGMDLEGLRDENERLKVVERVGEVVGERVWNAGRPGLVRIVLEQDVPL